MPEAESVIDIPHAPQAAAWTRELVALELAKAFAVLPHVGVHSPAAHVLKPVAGGARGRDALALIEATGRYLGPRSSERLALLTWSRARATGGSICRLCAENGWARASFYRRVTRAAARVAAGLNQDGAPPHD